MTRDITGRPLLLDDTVLVVSRKLGGWSGYYVGTVLEIREFIDKNANERHRVKVLFPSYDGKFTTSWFEGERLVKCDDDSGED